MTGSRALSVITATAVLILFKSMCNLYSHVTEYFTSRVMHSASNRHGLYHDTLSCLSMQKLRPILPDTA